MNSNVSDPSILSFGTTHIWDSVFVELETGAQDSSN